MSSYHTRSWEGWQPAGDAAPPNWGGIDDSDEFDYEKVDPETAGDSLYEFLVSLKLDSVISARHACIIAFWATKAGAIGSINLLSLRPDAQSGKFSRKFDSAVGTKPELGNMYSLGLALRPRHDATRVWSEIPILCLLEELVAEIESDPEVLQAFGRAKEADELPPLYYEHLAVRTAGPDDVVLPISLYVDAVAHHRLDSTLGFWGYVTTGGRRHLLTVVRRSELCSCGCRGWCTLFPIWLSTSWQLSSLVEGRYPTVRHDGLPFREQEQHRQARAGQLLPFKAMCLFLKSDLVEYSHTLGLAAHNDTIAPCPFCFAGLSELGQDCPGLSPMGTGWPVRTTQDYRQACEACEVTIAVNAADVAAITPHLHYNKDSTGPRGRALLSDDFAHLGLSRKDRLEPSWGLADVSTFEFRRPPFLASFWRRSRETIARHRNPVFSPATGVGLKNIGLDWLHILSLGVFQCFCLVLVWDAITANIYNVAGTFQNVFEITVGRMKNELWQWYSDEAALGRNHTRCQQLLPAMFGRNTARKFALHGSETNGFLHFCAKWLDRCGKLDARLPHYRAGIASLITIYSLIKRYPRKLPAEAQMEFVEAVALHLRACSTLDVQVVSRHHFLVEMAGRS
jgi:hypothetical protein